MLRRCFLVMMAALLALSCAACLQQPEQETGTLPVPQIPQTTAEPTQTETLPTTVATEPPVLLHSGIREDGTFDAGTLFLGDSLTLYLVSENLKPQGLLGDAKYAAKCGEQLTVFFSDTVLDYGQKYQSYFTPEFQGMTFAQVAQYMGSSATAIYYMFGTNYTREATAESYIEIVDYLLEVCPNATVHLQTIPYADPNIIPSDKVNERIRGAYAHYQELGEKRVMLLDTNTAIGKNLNYDGVHLNPEGRDNWVRAIYDHAQANDLPQ